MHTLKVAIIGSGPAGLMAADILGQNCTVDIYEKGKAIGRKFLVAGNGGFNITNSASDENLISKYSPHPALREALSGFDSNSTRKWLENLGIPTFIGSSGRVFPEKGIKPVQVLNKIKERLNEKGVNIHYHHEFVGFNEYKKPVVEFNDTQSPLVADIFIFALGGASWPVTGSNTKWRNAFEKIGVKTLPFEASNCGVNVNWSEKFKDLFAGEYLKNIQISINHKMRKGEAVITEYGLEGNAVYPLIPFIRNSLKSEEPTEIFIDLKPQNTHQSLLMKTRGRKLKTKNYSYEFNLSKAELAMTKQFTPKENYISPERFVEILKSVAIPVESLRPVEESISTIGGISMSEIENDFSLKSCPNIFVIGEMLNWDAPTGGYLLQGCFSTAVAATNSIAVFSNS